jgi:geranylgeranyl diphosphate synthase, type II
MTANNELSDYLEEIGLIIENEVYKYMPKATANNKSQLNKAIKYSLFSGGKRIRPVLTLLTARLFDADVERILPAAVAVEFIHSASLIFDDLPAMDNADERRGQVSLHQEFGEGIAVLAALSLLNASYKLIFKNQEGHLDLAIAAHSELVYCIGTEGMIGGQAIDLLLKQDAVLLNGNRAEAESMKNLKTSSLMRLSISLGAILGGGNRQQIADLNRFAMLLGEAYQLRDDFVDLEEDSHYVSEAVKNTVLSKLNAKITEANELLAASFTESDARTCLLQISESFTKVAEYC